LATTRRPVGEPSTRCAQRRVMFQSSVTSWSSNTVYVGTLASTRRAAGMARRAPSSNRASPWNRRASRAASQRDGAATPASCGEGSRAGHSASFQAIR
jgi:hypothetical protein